MSDRSEAFRSLEWVLLHRDEIRVEIAESPNVSFELMERFEAGLDALAAVYRDAMEGINVETVTARAAAAFGLLTDCMAEAKRRSPTE